MAQLNMATPFDSNKGKYAGTDQIYFKIRKFDEQTFGVRLKHPATNEPPSAGQQTSQLVSYAFHKLYHSEQQGG